jgi:hypothetical protein
MQLNFIKSLSLICTVILCVGMALSSVHATNNLNTTQEIQTDQSGPFCAQAMQSRHECQKATTADSLRGMIRPTLLAANQAACQWNYNNCMKGCDGMAQCSNQCMTNYNNCMRNT